MKDHFFEYYPIKKKTLEKIWDNGIFVFDANILLNLYRYSPQNREEIFSFIKKNPDCFWLPHQFALEYHKRRLKYVEGEMISYSRIMDRLQETAEKIEDHPFLKIRKKTIENIKKEINYINKEVKKSVKKYTDLHQHDPVRDKITSLFKGRVGDPYDSQKLEQIYKIGEGRYIKDIPPGYKDKDKKGDNKFGDLIGWFQMIDKAKKEGKYIIFITNEQKEDWWELQGKGKLVSPRHELIKEFFSETKGLFFDISSMEKFLERVLPKTKIIKEAKEIAEEIEDMVVTSPMTSSASPYSLESSDSHLADNDLVGGSDFWKVNANLLEKQNILSKSGSAKKQVKKKHKKTNRRIKKR